MESGKSAACALCSLLDSSIMRSGDLGDIRTGPHCMRVCDAILIG